jgi:hypothetical protein
MTLLLIARKIFRYKLAVLPILSLVLVGTIYVVAVKPPTYEADATYIMVNPPPPPTDAEIARDPSLAHIADDNPYTRFSDQSVLVQVMASRLDSDEARRALAAKGGDPNYTAAPSAEFGFTSPVLQVSGTGTSAAQAIATANLVGAALKQELDRIQTGVDRRYRIKSEPIVAAHDATLKPTGKLRALVAVFVLGGVMLFVVVSVLDAFGTLRSEWAQSRNAPDYREPDEDEFPLDASSLPPSDRDPEAEEWRLQAPRR